MGCVACGSSILLSELMFRSSDSDDSDSERSANMSRLDGRAVVPAPVRMERWVVGLRWESKWVSEALILEDCGTVP